MEATCVNYYAHHVSCFSVSPTIGKTYLYSQLGCYFLFEAVLQQLFFQEKGDRRNIPTGHYTSLHTIRLFVDLTTQSTDPDQDSDWLLIFLLSPRERRKQNFKVITLPYHNLPAAIPTGKGNRITHRSARHYLYNRVNLSISRYRSLSELSNTVVIPVLSDLTNIALPHTNDVPEQQFSQRTATKLGTGSSDGQNEKQILSLFHKTGKNRPVIVIDPGHGGVDPGATSASGIFEKNITLTIGLELCAKLLSTGHYHVVLTRDSDTFVSLRERIENARTHRADLFISLHADTTNNIEARGLSVYTLSERASDQEAAALAERENKVDLINGVDLSDESHDVASILIDLMQRETMNRSIELAGLFIRELRHEIQLLPEAHRFAGFAVLKAPDIPSVLLEIGYLSNLEEEQLLRQYDYRSRLEAILIRAVDQYFKEKQR